MLMADYLDVDAAVCFNDSGRPWPDGGVRPRGRPCSATASASSASTISRKRRKAGHSCPSVSCDIRRLWAPPGDPPATRLLAWMVGGRAGTNRTLRDPQPRAPRRARFQPWVERMTPQGLLRAMFDRPWPWPTDAEPCRRPAAKAAGAGWWSSAPVRPAPAWGPRRWRRNGGPCEGLVITRYGYARPCEGIEIVEAAHPVPDAAGVAATRRMLDLLKAGRGGIFVLAPILGRRLGAALRAGHGHQRWPRNRALDASPARLGARPSGR